MRPYSCATVTPAPASRRHGLEMLCALEATGRLMEKIMSEGLDRRCPTTIVRVSASKTLHGGAMSALRYVVPLVLLASTLHTALLVSASGGGPGIEVSSSELAAINVGSRSDDSERRFCDVVLPCDFCNPGETGGSWYCENSTKSVGDCQPTVFLNTCPVWAVCSDHKVYCHGQFCTDC